MNKTAEVSALAQELADALVNAADENYHDEGTCEIGDEGVVVSHNTVASIREAGGSYVQAWVWVSVEELPEPIRKKYKLGDS